jgi:cation/acetate symporter
MILSIFWKGVTRFAAVAGMLTGLFLTLYYMVINIPALRTLLSLEGSGLWFDIEPVSAGVFGVGAGLVVTVIVSWMTRGSVAVPQRS